MIEETSSKESSIVSRDRGFTSRLPPGWPRQARSAILHALSVARIALLAATDRAAASVRREHELALLREELRIKDARLERVPPHRRPHYPAAERLAILELRAARGCSAAQTAERFFVTAATVASWTMRLDEDGPSALVRTHEPVNRFPDLVAPAATVRSGRRIRSPRPNHIWLLDLTSVPTLAGLWIPWLPWSLPQRWPFCCWVAVGVDHVSRRIMGVREFRGRPTAKAMSAFLAGMIRAAGQAPRHLITDRGREFTAKSFPRGCRRAGIRQRFGAIGAHGSIALVERFIRTLKGEGVRRCLAPIRWRTVGPELSLFADWYIGQRPHAGLAGATPDEVRYGRRPAHCRPRFEPRERWPREAVCARPQASVRGRPGVGLALEVRYLEGRAHLPVVALTRAA